MHSFRPVGFAICLLCAVYYVRCNVYHAPWIMFSYSLWGVYAYTGYPVRCIVSVEHDLYKMYILILTCGCQCRALIPSRWFLCPDDYVHFLVVGCVCAYWVPCAVYRVH